MLDPKLIDDLTRRLHDSLPGNLQLLGRDLEDNLRAAVQAALSRLDLVTREEFEVQRKVLARSRALIEELSGRVSELERAQGLRPPAETSPTEPPGPAEPPARD